MIDVNDLRKGVTFTVDGNIYKVLEYSHNKPGRGNATIRTTLRDLRTGATIQRTFQSGDRVQDIRVESYVVEYLYNDGEYYYFMDTSTYEQIQISAEVMGDAKDYLVGDAVIRVEFYGEEPVGIELPQVVDLVVKETVPGIKGATASAQVKPATLETGLIINVPSFINEGDRIRVNTETGEYQARA